MQIGAPSPSITMASSSRPSPSQPLQQRLQALVQHQQFFWWVGHVVIVLASLLHGIQWVRFDYKSNLSLFWYRLALLGAIGSYGVVVHKMFFRVFAFERLLM
jgi:transmembrane protein 33